MYEESAIQRLLTKQLIIGCRKFIPTEILFIGGNNSSELRKYYAGFDDGKWILMLVQEKGTIYFPSVGWFSGSPWIFTFDQISLATGKVLPSIITSPHNYGQVQALKGLHLFYWQRLQLQQPSEDIMAGPALSQIITGMWSRPPSPQPIWTVELRVNIRLKPSCIN